ncbi:hypothetical protein NMY22_g11060 [Coprinellus aureogranulatus]|nr:hypothetical protein NMY22_g11060 [Coprinellus aureogranulatus]
MAPNRRQTRRRKNRAPPPSRPPTPALESPATENTLQARFPPAEHNYDPRLMRNDEIIYVMQSIGEILDAEIRDIQRSLEEIREDDALAEYAWEPMAASTPGTPDLEPTATAPATPDFKPMEIVLPALLDIGDSHHLSDPLESAEVSFNASEDAIVTPRRSSRLVAANSRLTESNLKKFNEANKTHRR